MGEPIRLVPQPVAAFAKRTSDFEDLVTAEHAALFGALRLITDNRAEAEDVMQEAFLKVWEHWDRVRVMDDPAGYLYRTALNVYRKRLRRASVMIRRAAHVAPHSDELSQIESRDIVIRALSTLTPRQRMSVVLTDLLDYSSEDAGRAMGVKAATVRVLVSQGRAALRRKLGEEHE